MNEIIGFLNGIATKNSIKVNFTVRSIAANNLAQFIYHPQFHLTGTFEHSQSLNFHHCDFFGGCGVSMIHTYNPPYETKEFKESVIITSELLQFLHENYQIGAIVAVNPIGPRYKLKKDFLSALEFTPIIQWGNTRHNGWPLALWIKSFDQRGGFNFKPSEQLRNYLVSKEVSLLKVLEPDYKKINESVESIQKITIKI